MSKQMNIPPLRFPEFTGEWEKKKLGEVSNNIMYGMNSAAIAFDGTNKYLRITDIDENTREYIPKPLVSPDGEIEEKFKLKYGDIVFTRTGASVGKTYLYNPKDGNLLFAGFLIKFSIINGNPYFIFTQTLKEEYNKWVLKMSMRSGQPGLNAEECKELEISFPSLPEQTKIATFLKAVDEKLQALKKKHSLLEQYKKGVMQRLFSSELGLVGLEDDKIKNEKNPTILQSKKSQFRQLRFKDENGKDFPEWEVKKLGEVTYKTDKKNKQREILPVYSISNVNGFVPQSEQFDGVDSNERGYDTSLYKIIEENTFVYNPARINVGSIGFSGSIGRVIVSSLYVCFKTNDYVNDLFFNHYLNTPFFKDSVMRKGEGGVRIYLFYENFSEIEINLPSLKEQTAIAHFLSALDEKINQTQTQIEKTETWKKGLLQKMFV